MVEHLTSLSQLDGAMSKKGLTVIDFHATWCRPCHMIAPFYEKLASQHSANATFFKCDVDACRDVASRYQVSAMPTFIFLDKTGKVLSTVRGADQRVLESTLSRHLGSTPKGGSGNFPTSGGHRLGGDEPSSSAHPVDGLQMHFRRILMAVAFVGLLYYYRGSAGGQA
ncbi:thioredoxin-like protein [Atractiella rhizophila]|nr:thioredoxin-like protein [Atractiella rhizophila]